MLYDGYHFGGMHLIWWFLWLMFVFWMFATPYTFFGYRTIRDYPIDILKRRLASGDITNEEYHEKKRILESSLAK